MMEGQEDLENTGDGGLGRFGKCWEDLESAGNVGPGIFGKCQ